MIVPPINDFLAVRLVTGNFFLVFGIIFATVGVWLRLMRPVVEWRWRSRYAIRVRRKNLPRDLFRVDEFAVVTIRGN
jgi:hypothetical protein